MIRSFLTEAKSSGIRPDTDAYCTYIPDASGKLIFADANYPYYCLAGKTIEDLGKTSGELFSDDHPVKLAKLCRLGSDTAVCPVRFGDMLVLIEASLSENKLVCKCSAADTAGKEAAADIARRLSVNRFNESFCGSLTAVLKNGSFVPEILGCGAEKLFVSPREHRDIRELFAESFEAADISAVCGELSDGAPPADLFLLSKYLHSEKRGTRAVVHISACPLISSEKRIVFSFAVMEHEPVKEPVTGFTAAGIVRVSGDGRGIFLSMTDHLAVMLGNGTVSSEEIFGAASDVIAGDEGGKLIGGSEASVFAYPDDNNGDRAYIAVFGNDTASEGYGLRFPELTRREYTVIRYAADGLLNNEIAEKLGISEGTVSKTLYNCYRKLNIASRIDAARLF